VIRTSNRACLSGGSERRGKGKRGELCLLPSFLPSSPLSFPSTPYNTILTSQVDAITHPCLRTISCMPSSLCLSLSPLTKTTCPSSPPPAPAAGAASKTTPFSRLISLKNLFEESPITKATRATRTSERGPDRTIQTKGGKGEREGGEVELDLRREEERLSVEPGESR